MTRDVQNSPNVRRGAGAALALGALTVVIAVAVVTVNDDTADDEPAQAAPPSTARPAADQPPPSVTTTVPVPVDEPPYDMDETLMVTAVRTGRHEGADRFVVQFNRNLDDDDVIEAVDGLVWSDGLSYALEDAPYFAECEELAFGEGMTAFVNVQVPSDGSTLGPLLGGLHQSDDTAKMSSVAAVCAHGGMVYFTAALSEPGEVNAFVLEDPGRLVIDVT